MFMYVYKVPVNMYITRFVLFQILRLCQRPHNGQVNIEFLIVSYLNL